MEQVHATKQRLLDTAQELFYARSYADVGVQEICEKAGVKKGSFYHFFPSKRDLTLAMLDESWRHLKESMLDQAFARDIPPLQRFERFLDMSYEHHKAVKAQTGRVLGCPYGNLAGELSTQDDEIRARINRIFQEIELPMEAALQEAMGNGDLPAIDARATAEAMVAYIEGLTLIAKTRNDPDILRQLGGAAMSLIVPVKTA